MGWEALLLAKLPALSMPLGCHGVTTATTQRESEGTAHQGMPNVACARGYRGAGGQGSQRQPLQSHAGSSSKVGIDWLYLTGHIYPAPSPNSSDCLERRDRFPTVHLHKIEKNHLFRCSAEINRLCPSEMLVLQQLSTLEWI